MIVLHVFPAKVGVEPSELATKVVVASDLRYIVTMKTLPVAAQAGNPPPNVFIENVKGEAFKAVDSVEAQLVMLGAAYTIVANPTKIMNMTASMLAAFRKTREGLLVLN